MGLELSMIKTLKRPNNFGDHIRTQFLTIFCDQNTDLELSTRRIDWFWCDQHNTHTVRTLKLPAIETTQFELCKHPPLHHDKTVWVVKQGSRFLFFFQFLIE